MAVSVYIILGLVVVVSALRLAGAVWEHHAASIIKALGEIALLGGVLVNFTALRHIGYSWATLPSWVYTVPIWVGGLIFLIVHLLELRRVMKMPSVVNNIKDYGSKGS